MLRQQAQWNLARSQPRRDMGDVALVGQTVIIGHGRSPERRGWGARIDAAPRVIRMWNWDWQDPADYGARYDLGIIETHAKVLRQWRECNARMPALGWLASMLLCDLETYCLLPRPCETIDQECWTRQGDGAGEHGEWQLTRGGIAACWAIDHSDPGGEIVLVGFDNIRAGVALAPDAAFAPVYQRHPGFWGMAGYREGATKEGNHDYAGERRLLAKLSAARGVSLWLAEDIWP